MGDIAMESPPFLLDRWLSTYDLAQPPIAFKLALAPRTTGAGEARLARAAALDGKRVAEQTRLRVQSDVRSSSLA
jgi:hypothetical protein